MANSRIFGELYADIYDVIYENKNYGHECDLLEELFEKKISVKTILDLGCGTGGHAKELENRGYQVIGVDQSPHMIKIAQNKNLPFSEFKLGDIRDFDLNQTFDVLILMFNVIGYLTGDSVLSSFFETARRHLNHNGLLIFDFLYGPAVHKTPPVEKYKFAINAGLNIERKTNGKLVPNRNCILIDCNLKFGETITRESHMVRFFELEELKLLLRRFGFKEIKFGQFSDISEIPNADNWSAISWSKTE